MKPWLLVSAVSLTVALTMGIGEEAARAAASPPAPGPVTFSEHIAPLVFQNCATCHRPDGGAPFSLLTYEDVAKRARMIASVTADRYMPPWHAEPTAYPFKDERRLTSQQIALVQAWVQQGMPRGDAAKLPRPPVFASGWQLGNPDLVVKLPAPYSIPAEGPDIYRAFAVPLGLVEDKWIRAIEIRPSARTAVHHVLYFADATGEGRRADAADPAPGYERMRAGFRNSLGGWALGQQPHLFPDGIALALPKASDLILQYHFHPSGKPEREESVIGLHFADRAPARSLTPIQLPVLFGFFSGIDIPPGSKDFRVTDSFVLPVDVEAVTVGAHAHYLGKEMKLRATFPNGDQKVLLWIKDWDFAWQDRYFFESLVPLPKGTRLDAEIRWDNSGENPSNPTSPPVRVRWGEGSTDEMGSITLQVLPRVQADLPALQSAYRTHLRGSVFGGHR